LATFNKILMKLLFKIIILLVCLPLIACNALQEGIPDAVKAAFAKKYPGENDPDWFFDKNGNYEAKFKKDGIHYRADFTPQGVWVETETNIKEKELPKAIKKVIKEKYDDLKIAEIEKVESNAKGLFYDVEFKVNGTKKDVEFNASGQILN